MEDRGVKTAVPLHDRTTHTQAPPRKRLPTARTPNGDQERGVDPGDDPLTHRGEEKDRPSVKVLTICSINEALCISEMVHPIDNHAQTLRSTWRPRDRWLSESKTPVAHPFILSFPFMARRSNELAAQEVHGP